MVSMAGSLAAEALRKRTEQLITMDVVLMLLIRAIPNFALLVSHNGVIKFQKELCSN
jgi:hypothetical protein